MDSQKKITWRNSPWTVVIGFPLLCVLAFAFIFLVLPGTTRDRPNPTQRCRGNLSQIELVKKMWAEDEGKSTNDAPTEADLYGTNSFLREKLACPVGGTYTIGFVGEKPRCSIPGHTI